MLIVFSAVSKPQYNANYKGSSEHGASVVHVGGCDWAVEREIEPNHDETYPDNRGNVHREPKPTE